MSRARLALCVLLPFAAGYYLSYLFRSINAVIAGDLSTELGLNAADLGALTSAYFLVFAAVVLPCGVLPDRYGPRLVDSALLLVAAVGWCSPLPTGSGLSCSAAR
jgi:sugar phosphate permease